MDESIRDQAPAAPNKNLFIGGLAWAATDEDLKAAFEPFGAVLNAAVVRYPENNRSRGYGFVEFENLDDAVKAKEEMNGKEIAGRSIMIDFARDKK